jgi:hypothetical protein
MGPLDRIPILVLFLLTLLLGFVAVEAGRWFGGRRRHQQAEPEAPVGAAVGATLGLLAFILAFTFGMAASRFDVRKQMVVEDANAIGTTYLRVSFMPEPPASKLRLLLREYTDTRVDAGLHPERFPAALARSEELQRMIWSEASAAVTQHPNVLTALFMDALNNMIDTHGLRLAAIRNRIPLAIWFFLFVTAGVGMLSIGYHAGLSGSRRSVAATALVVAFSGVIMLIADLDRPEKGFLRINQQAMIDLQKSIQTELPAVTAEPPPPP